MTLILEVNVVLPFLAPPDMTLIIEVNVCLPFMAPPEMTLIIEVNVVLPTRPYQIWHLELKLMLFYLSGPTRYDT